MRRINARSQSISKSVFRLIKIRQYIYTLFIYATVYTNQPRLRSNHLVYIHYIHTIFGFGGYYTHRNLLNCLQLSWLVVGRQQGRSARCGWSDAICAPYMFCDCLILSAACNVCTVWWYGCVYGLWVCCC